MNKCREVFLIENEGHVCQLIKNHRGPHHENNFDWDEVMKPDFKIKDNKSFLIVDDDW